MSAQVLDTSTVEFEDAERLAQYLMDAKKEGRHRTLILGAGASRAANVPLFKTVCERLIRNYRIKSGEEDPIVAVQKWYAEPDRPRALALEGVVGSATPTIGYLHLAQLLEKGVFDLVLTTNWDSLVETALATVAPTHHYQLLSRKQVSDTLLGQYLKRPPAANLVVKLHGDLSGRLFMAITQDELAPIKGALRKQLVDRLQDEVVIAGHSLNDPDIADLLQGRKTAHVTYAGPSHPEETVLRAANLDSPGIDFIHGHAGRFDTFMAGLHVAYERKLFEDRPPDLSGVVTRIRIAAERGTNFLNNAGAREKIKDLHRELANSRPDLVLFIHDRTAPGGSEIQRLLEHEPEDPFWREGIATVVREGARSSVPPQVDLEAARGELEGKNAAVRIVLVDSCAFSGETILRVGQAVHRLINAHEPRPIQLEALLLALHPNADSKLRTAKVDGTSRRVFVEVKKVLELNRHEMTFPWGITEMTSTLNFGIPDLDGPDGVMNLEVSGKAWGMSQRLGNIDTRTVRLNTLMPGADFSFHRHLLRSELFVPLDEGIRMQLATDRPTPEPTLADAEFTSLMLEPGQPVLVPRGVWHRLIAPRQWRARVMEVGFGLYDEEYDHDVARPHSVG